MTPLAERFVRRMTLPLKDQEPLISQDADVAADEIFDIHCFECTELHRVVSGIIKSEDKCKAGFSVAFLPAPKTWVEWEMDCTDFKMRIAVLFVEGSDKKSFESFLYAGADDGPGLSAFDLALGQLNAGDNAIYTFTQHFPDLMEDIEPGFSELSSAAWILMTALCFVALINTPRIFGRRQYMPSRKLEKRIAKKFGGQFPLHAWHEIKLEVTKPTEIDDGEPHEAHLTGERAFHFCRAHLRFKNGRVEFVTAHWRGNRNRGIRNARYVVS